MSVQTSDISLGPPRRLVHVRRRPASLFRQRLVDCIICFFAMPLAVALGGVIALSIRLDGGPALYSQRRVGHGGRIFNCLKFRSMVLNADERLEEVLAADPSAREQWERYQKLEDDPRITPLGRILRACSLDELPQLINVCRGEMSIVGPRPILTEQVLLYGESFPEYCRLRPGITGLWQIAGRNKFTFAERVRLDMQYAKSWSVWSDLRIILLTIPAVLAGRGAK
ncbi:MAG TPA: sugar transferase [Rhizomicrobium sp.]|jgi:undecaprenyl-phosphate galactose phosphotransferase